MFGYVFPCKMELKIKDYEKFKAYYCGLCCTIKQIYGNIPRLVLNYDMTFASILFDSVTAEKSSYRTDHCITHPIKKRIITNENDALNYAAFLNICLSYYKFLDNIADDNSTKSKIAALYLKKILKKFPQNYENIKSVINEKLNMLYRNEKDPNIKSLDELCNPFSELTGFIFDAYTFKENYFDINDYEDNSKSYLYNLGYNLGKWIYIIDAFNDLEKDMKSNKFNAINSTLNKEKLPITEFREKIENRIDFTLTTCARMCLQNLNDIKLFKNHDLLHNIIEFGLLEKMNTVFKRNNKTDKI